MPDSFEYILRKDTCYIQIFLIRNRFCCESDSLLSEEISGSKTSLQWDKPIIDCLLDAYADKFFCESGESSAAALWANQMHFMKD